MKRFLSLLAVCALAAPNIASARSPLPDDVGLCHPSNPATPISRVKPGPYRYGERKVVDLPSDYDGQGIHMGYVRPKTPPGMRVPVIVFASPYLGHNLNNEDLVNCTPRLVQNYVSHGYAVGFVAVRGTSDSGGCSDLMGNAERADLDQAISWFGKQKWSNGRVGMVGVSYDGSTPWEVASMGNKYLKTIVPISGVNDLYHLMYRNGAPEFRGPVVLNALYYLYGFQEYNFTNGRSPQNMIEGIVCPEALKGFYASIHSSATGERDPLGYWAERNSRPGVEKNYKGSIFLVHGLQDWNVDPAHDFPWIYELEKKGLYVKYLLGQWSHAWPDSNPNVTVIPAPVVRWDWAKVLLEWWDHWLKGDKSARIGPRVQVQDSSGLWRNEDAWPPSNARATKFFLNPESELSTTASKESEEATVAFDPQRVGAGGGSNSFCPGCLRLETQAFKDEFRFAGVSSLDLEVTPTGPGGFVSGWIYHSDGTIDRRVGWGMVDLRYAHGGETAQVVVPGQTMEVSVPIEPLDVVIPRGDKLVLVISQGAYGGPDHLPTSPPWPLRVRLGDRASSLNLNVFEAQSESFFRPPLNPPKIKPPRR